MNLYRLMMILGVVCLLNGCYYDSKEDRYQFIQPVECDIVEARFIRDIVPILETHCLRCHRNERQDGNVNLQGYNNAKQYAEDGSLFGTTNHDSGYSVMPTNGIKIPACQIESLRIWIEDGALNN